MDFHWLFHGTESISNTQAQPNKKFPILYAARRSKSQLDRKQAYTNRVYILTPCHYRPLLILILSLVSQMESFRLFLTEFYVDFIIKFCRNANSLGILKAIKLNLSLDVSDDIVLLWTWLFYFQSPWILSGDWDFLFLTGRTAKEYSHPYIW
jgi:hypothetical protein